MKNQQYIILKKIYKMSRNHDDFVKEDLLLSLGCSREYLTDLEFDGLLIYKREDKTTYYKLSRKGINQMLKLHKDNWNFILSFIAAISSVIGILLSVLNLL